ncbi:unnamed protein product [Rotaria sordida]|uniref:Uncharacterized protein n=1 Tax=Rotaria sordida TaxID=392033 RepID=A0A813V2H8_9BILA|nr:unnamed protein product [Rotaria sordida]
MHANRCIVYYDKYIDCKIRAPITIQAINNRLTYMFHCIERRLYLQPKVYRQHPKLRENVRTFNDINQTTIYTTNLHPNSCYCVRFHCRRHGSFDTISDVECNRYQTLKFVYELCYKYFYKHALSLILRYYRLIKLELHQTTTTKTAMFFEVFFFLFMRNKLFI